MTEVGLRHVVKEKQVKTRKWKWKSVTRGGGLTDEFKNAGWDKIRDEIYQAHGA